MNKTDTEHYKKEMRYINTKKINEIFYLYTYTNIWNEQRTIEQTDIYYTFCVLQAYTCLVVPLQITGLVVPRRSERIVHMVNVWSGLIVRAPELLQGWNVWTTLFTPRNSPSEGLIRSRCEQYVQNGAERPSLTNNTHPHVFSNNIFKSIYYLPIK